MIRTIFHNILQAACRKTYGCQGAVRVFRHSLSLCFVLLFACTMLFSCYREPELYLPYRQPASLEFPLIDLDLLAYWDYELEYGIIYDWQSEWYYQWDEEDSRTLAGGGPIGYSEPKGYQLRRYYLGYNPNAKHTTVLADAVKGRTFHGEYNWGFWDILVWSDVITYGEEAQSLIFDETSSLDEVKAFTNPSMHSARYQAPAYTRAFYQPEQLFSAYDRGEEINENLEGFEYDSIRNVYIKQMGMKLEPITYIYLTQVILHNNKNKIIGVDGTADLSGMARSTNVNTGLADSTPITVTYNVRLKNNCILEKTNENVDIAGGRVMTFGICNQNGNRIDNVSQVKDKVRHYMDLKMQFNNGIDSTFVFDVTDQVRKRWKGGVITVELNMDTVPIPRTKGGSAFDAIVKDYEDGGTHEFGL